MIRLSLVALVLLAGCEAIRDFGRFRVATARDSGVVDLSQAPVEDLSLPAPDDLTTRPDLADPWDLAEPPDLARVDLALRPDLVPPPDLVAPCAGWRGGPNGACWYVGDYGTSCVNFCAKHGGFDMLGTQHTGGAVMKHFFPNAIFDGTISGLEDYFPGSNTRWEANGQPDPGVAGIGQGHFACACNQ